jgi:hypothetical protein
MTKKQIMTVKLHRLMARFIRILPGLPLRRLCGKWASERLVGPERARATWRLYDHLRTQKQNYEYN